MMIHVHAGRRKALERKAARLHAAIPAARERIAEIRRRDGLTERGRKQQVTLWENRIRQMEDMLATIAGLLARG